MIDGSRHARYEKTINVTSPTANFEDESSDLVTKSWQLCSRTPSSGMRTLASGVLAYDSDEDGHIIFSNGNAIFLFGPDGRKEHVLNEATIEQVFLIPAN